MLQLCSIVRNKIYLTCLSYRRSLSYLYVTGDKAREIYSAVQPHIDFDRRIGRINELDSDLKKRKINLDVHELKKLWDFYKTRLDHKQKLELNRKEIKLALERLLTDNANGSNDNEIDSLKLKFRFVRDDLKNITKTIWDIENNVILKALQIPNELDSKVPVEEIVVSSYNEKLALGNDHLEVGKLLNCLDYYDKSSYYLKNDLALFEIVASQYFVNQFTNFGFIPTINADFGRSVIIEGCTLKSFAPDQAFVLKNLDEEKKDKLYLCGGASLLQFYGLYTRQAIEGGQRPVRFVTAGKQYNPKPSNTLSGLYSVWQSNAVEIFISGIEEDELTTEFDNTVQKVIDVYNSLNVHFRVVNVPAHELKPWESLRMGFQVYSSANNIYVEIGNVSLIGDFISKRLQAHSVNKKQLSFLNVISGTVFRLPVLIANLLENSSKTELHIPNVLKNEMTF